MGLKQSRIASFIEANINTFVGFGVSLLITYFIIPPLFGLTQSPEVALGITSIYTLVSVVRNYLVRRWFNRREGKVNLSPHQVEHQRQADFLTFQGPEWAETPPLLSEEQQQIEPNRW